MKVNVTAKTYMYVILHVIFSISQFKRSLSGDMKDIPPNQKLSNDFKVFYCYNKILDIIWLAMCNVRGVQKNKAWD